jgi:hypothetical protein
MRARVLTRPGFSMRPGSPCGPVLHAARVLGASLTVSGRERQRRGNQWAIRTVDPTVQLTRQAVNLCQREPS